MPRLQLHCVCALVSTLRRLLEPCTRDACSVLWLPFAVPPPVCLNSLNAGHGVPGCWIAREGGGSQGVTGLHWGGGGSLALQVDTLNAGSLFFAAPFGCTCRYVNSLSEAHGVPGFFDFHQSVGSWC